MRLGGSPASSQFGWAILLAAFAAALLVLPSAEAQACGGETTPPHCMQPDVSVELPDEVWASYDSIEQSEPDEVAVELNVTYESDADDETEVTVQPAGGPFEAEGGTATVATGETVTVPVNVTVPGDARAGGHDIPLVVNTSATDLHESTSREVEGQLSVPWVVREWHTRWDVTDEEDGFAVNVRVEELLVNGPVDLLVVSENQTPEPALHEIQQARPGRPVTVEWNLTLRGPIDRRDASLYPVVASGDGLACIEKGTGRLIGLEDGDPPEACQIIGSTSATVTRLTGAARTLHLASMGLILLGMIASLGLGGYVLRHAWRETPGLSLGGYLVLAGMAFGTLASSELLGLTLRLSVTDLVGFDESLLIFPTMALLPGALLTFAVSYPSLHPSLRGRRAWPLATLGPSVLLTGYLLVSFLLEEGSDVMPPSRGVPLIGSFVLGALLAAWIFRRRSQGASTDLERQRLRYMERAVALPFALGAAALLAVYLTDVLGGMAAYASGLIALVVAVMALGPAAGMAWGLLKYKVVDLETKLRFTVSRGFVVSVFVAIFFVASEAAETFFTAAIGPYAGLVAAGLLVLAIAPLERLGRKVASGVVDEPVDEEEYRHYRKLEVYRATYEEATADQDPSDRERATLDAMAENLGLSEEERSFVEEQVAQERASGGRDGTGGVPA